MNQNKPNIGMPNTVQPCSHTHTHTRAIYRTICKPLLNGILKMLYHFENEFENKAIKENLSLVIAFAYRIRCYDPLLLGNSLVIRILWTSVKSHNRFFSLLSSPPHEKMNIFPN